MIQKIKEIIMACVRFGVLLITPFKSRANCLDREETIEELEKKEKSFIRLGDGEFILLQNKIDIVYQKYSVELEQELRKIITDYNQNKENNYLLAVPYEPFAENMLWYLKNKYIYFKCFALFRYYFRFHMNQKRTYGCAMAFARGNEKKYEAIWEYAENIIFLHNDEKWAINFQEKYSKETHFIKVPPRDSFEEIDRIEKEVLLEVEKSRGKKYCILISAGPAAKILVYRLAQKNIIAYDCGHCWDEPLEMPDLEK